MCAGHCMMPTISGKVYVYTTNGAPKAHSTHSASLCTILACSMHARLQLGYAQVAYRTESPRITCRDVQIVQTAVRHFRAHFAMSRTWRERQGGEGGKVSASEPRRIERSRGGRTRRKRRRTDAPEGVGGCWRVGRGRRTKAASYRRRYEQRNPKKKRKRGENVVGLIAAGCWWCWLVFQSP